jgi:5-formyltetrahydrofolate cyclo-ligase
MDTKVEKENLRKWAKEVRLNIDLKTISSNILKKIVNLKEYKASKNVMSYHAKELEVSLKDLFDDKEKNWFLPTIGLPNYKSLLVVPYLPHRTKLNYGIFGVYEPEIIDNVFFDQADKKIDLDIIFVPGLCFNKDGYRVGYGKGFYDTFLKLNPNALKIGCCPKSCMIEKIPAEEWDIKVDMVITD